LVDSLSKHISTYKFITRTYGQTGMAANAAY